ncbi:hypothetical protein HNQ50_002472 [Silvimonas terrae]|uniref:Uncharacterized protein n=1 Tax=Silvimonas terrae TaxID=300266 RepID=A0A840RHJ4_9NEIS|nr:hypothetical protein [Silvimonas terrae]MBB5191742.1 hypothetical protein [Silvimonas terrae]
MVLALVGIGGVISASIRDDALPVVITLIHISCAIGDPCTRPVRGILFQLVPDIPHGQQWDIAGYVGTNLEFCHFGFVKLHYEVDRAP